MAEDRGALSGLTGSPYMLYVVAALLAILTFAFLVYAAVRWTRPGSPGVAWLFASFFLLLCVLLWAWG